MNKEFFFCGPARIPVGDRLVLEAEVTLGPGELVVLTGQSGSGKTSLLKAIAAISSAWCEKRIVLGRDMSSGSLPVWRSRVVLLAQDAPMLRDTLEHNLSFPFHLKNTGKKVFEKEKAESLLRKMGISASLQQDAGSLSGGERHRAALVRGILFDPPVLLADEPFSGSDPENKAACFNVLREHVKRGDRAVLVVLHDRELLEKADRILMIRENRLVAV
ncbi:MAG: ATP-binding cassette domain-containing protein [Deltaproteobacteria bacterium]|nr:ATP-binding cassette domain-containing protein [Deltaproteobacteria bacterium]